MRYTNRSVCVSWPGSDPRAEMRNTAWSQVMLPRSKEKPTCAHAVIVSRPGVQKGSPCITSTSLDKKPL